MKLPNVILTTVALSSIIVGAQAAEVFTGIAAVVNGKVITTSEVRNAAQMQVHMLVMENRGMSQGQLEGRVREIEKNALQDLVDRELILDKFKELGATIQPQHVDEAVNRFIRERFKGSRAKFLGELEKSGMTIQQFRKMQEETIVIQAMRSKNAGTNDVIVTPREREEFWKENRKLFSSEGRVKLRTITIAKTADGQSQEGLVKEIRGKLVEGADFASMARAYSVDSGAQDGGSRGEFGPGDLNGKLADVAFNIPVQTVSSVIDLGDFYTLVYVDARESGAVAPLTEVEDEVHRRVLQNKRQEKVERWLERLRRDANIRIMG